MKPGDATIRLVDKDGRPSLLGLFLLFFLYFAADVLLVSDVERTEKM